MKKTNFMKECYEKYVTPEVKEQAEQLTDEECGIIIVNKE